ncbi:MAG: amidohydrolase family protein [Firmicutes bacterium]|nr:amidohydrolase family protein [Bacillota bacterium]
MKKADKILYGGVIYTSYDKEAAEAVAIADGEFICVGTLADCEAYIGENTEMKDLSGKLVLPGLIDGHTHPITIAKTIWHVRMPDVTDKEELLATIREHAEKNPKEEVPYFYGECYHAETFGPEGPTKELLDSVISDRPARIQDFTDHACWYNSMAIDMLGVRDNSGHIGSPIGHAEVMRDESGEPTGWVLESGPDGDYGIYEKLGWYPPEGTEEESVGPFLDSLKEKGVICLMDGFTESENVMKLFYDLDKAGKLNMYYQGAAFIGSYDELEEGIANVRSWSEKYSTDHIGINTIKFFVDGTNEMGDSASLEPLKNDPSGTNYGMINATEEEMTKIMVRLNEEKIDLHLHIVCDRAFRVCCNAVENARKICGDEWSIYVTFCHCELVHPDDMARVADLGIMIDWSTHWAGGYFGEAAIEFLGRERWETMYDFTKMIEDGAVVGHSSDVFSYIEAHRANPFMGIQTTATRVDLEDPLDPEKYPGSVRPPSHAKLSVAQQIKGYTYNNAYRMRMLDKTGTIEEGKKANLVVLDKNIFEIPMEEIHTIDPVAVMFEGEYIK